MSYLPEDSAQHLMDEARKAAMHSYSPYSHFAVGAAVLAANGAIYHGSNAENASYGLTICAERTAMGNALAAGNTNIKAVAVWASTDSLSPCGACRQFVMEFGKDIIIVFMQQQQLMQCTVEELLPYAFSKKTME